MKTVTYIDSQEYITELAELLDNDKEITITSICEQPDFLADITDDDFTALLPDSNKELNKVLNELEAIPKTQELEQLIQKLYIETYEYAFKAGWIFGTATQIDVYDYMTIE